MKINVLICCKTYLLAEGLKKLLEDDEEISVVGISCCNGDLEEAFKLDKDVVIADQACYNAIFREGHEQDPMKILLLGSSSSFSLPYRDLQEVVSRGLVGLVSNTSDSKLLKKAIKTVNSGELWIDRKTIDKSLNRAAAPTRDMHLTKKETEVLHYLCSGFTNKEMSEKLSISEPTVKSHVNHLFKKFGVSNRLKLAICASKIKSEHPEELKEA
jgi:DNA-binding NarL/FixJ family response regulator